LHRLAHLPTHHPLQLGDRGFHHAGQVLERAADGDLGFDGFELALELLNLAQALRDDFGVLFVELFEAVELFLLSLMSVSRPPEFLAHVPRSFHPVAAGLEEARSSSAGGPAGGFGP
jgi:hypothetical protein